MQREELADFRRMGSPQKGVHNTRHLEEALVLAQNKARALQIAFNELQVELDEVRRDSSTQHVERLRAENAELAAGLGLLIKSKEEAQLRLKNFEGMDASRRISLLEQERDSAERTCDDLRQELSLAREVMAKAKGGVGEGDAARGGGRGDVASELTARLEESEMRAAKLESSAASAAAANAMRVHELEGSVALLEVSLEGAHQRARRDQQALQDALSELARFKGGLNATAGEGGEGGSASSPSSSLLPLPEDVASLQRSLRIAIEGRNDAEKRFERAREEALKWSRLVGGRQDHSTEYEAEMQRSRELEYTIEKLEAKLASATERLGQESVFRELVEGEKAKNGRLERLLEQVNDDMAFEVKGWRNKLEEEMQRRAQVEARLQEAVREAEQARKVADEAEQARKAADETERARKVADEAAAREMSAREQGGDATAVARMGGGPSAVVVDAARQEQEQEHERGDHRGVRMSEADAEEWARMEREIVDLKASLDTLQEEREQAASKWGALEELMQVRPRSMHMLMLALPTAARLDVPSYLMMLCAACVHTMDMIIHECMGAAARQQAIVGSCILLEPFDDFQA